MARQFNVKSDNSYNARRRYYRSAERNLKKAEESSGANAARYRTVARQNLEDALATYDPDVPKQKMSKPIRDLADRLNIDLDKRRGEIERGTGVRDRQRVVNRSTLTLEESLQDERVRREYEAYAVFNDPKIGRRIIGGFVEIWRDKLTVGEDGKIDKSKIFPLLFEYFKVNSLADLLEKVENIIGDELYKNEDSDVGYETVKLLIQTKVADNTVTA